MAIWGATGGGDAGYEIFAEFSRRWKCGRPTESDIIQCWKEICGCPPNNIGAGTIYHMAKQAAPHWRAAYQAKRIAAAYSFFGKLRKRQ